MPRAVASGAYTYEFLLIYADKELIRDIAATVRFLDILGTTSISVDRDPIRWPRSRAIAARLSRDRDGTAQQIRETASERIEVGHSYQASRRA